MPMKSTSKHMFAVLQEGLKKRPARPIKKSGGLSFQIIEKEKPNFL